MFAIYQCLILYLQGFCHKNVKICTWGMASSGTPWLQACE